MSSVYLSHEIVILFSIQDEGFVIAGNSDE